MMKWVLILLLIAAPARANEGLTTVADWTAIWLRHKREYCDRLYGAAAINRSEMAKSNCIRLGEVTAKTFNSEFYFLDDQYQGADRQFMAASMLFELVEAIQLSITQNGDHDIDAAIRDATIFVLAIHEFRKTGIGVSGAAASKAK